ncbi:L-fucose:H+ symporter permease [Fictibacillus barbaricus]|uniref:FHS family L-fucose permease-like MFS transporter n=1 Tax=Fictibacillus barbaricus TaxID=182136 RepID=A0ABU1U3E0_9BACL|nr:L-fucose:H+ symporter permease [Fictibacillus barbaricus]MDR7074005.1 FHS family L-fucose permease-like MFS transporter [Fictibacillus barbaricus]
MKNLTQLPDGYLNKTPIFQFILLSLLFPLWAAAASLNDILITQFKHVFELSDFASALVQSAFYGGYFLIAIPASIIIKKTTYKLGIIIGLLFYIAGCALFFPASHIATYTMFLFALFSIAIGLGFLETAANTYSSMIGPRKYSILRLNISQTFHPIGAISGILLGKYLVFQKGANLEARMANMSPAEAKAFGLEMLQHTLQPYKYMIFVLIAVLILFIITKFPACKPLNSSGEQDKSPSIKETLKHLGSNKRYRKGIIAQFLYVGLQVTVWSFTIRLALNLDSTLNERNASNFMIYSFIAYFCGKFIANFLMTRFSPSKVLFIYSIIGALLLFYVSFVPNMTAVYGAIAVSVLMGPCWPTIYAETLEVIKDKKYTEMAGAILVMAIIGGAVVPAIHGVVSDMLGSLQTAFIVPAACFIYIAYYFYNEMKSQHSVNKTVPETAKLKAQ